MKSLFLRLLVSMWLTMTVLGAVFAVIHAYSFQPDATQRWRRVSSRTTELRALQALDCTRTAQKKGDGSDESCKEILEPLDARDPRIAIYKDGIRIMGGDLDGAADIESVARASRGPSLQTVGERELSALYLANALDGPYVVVSAQRKPSGWLFFFVPETLPLRLLTIAIVTGAVAFFLARYLSRPLRTLRAATQRLAAGDLSVRVEPDLAGADNESLALGHEMDRMAERIEGLLDAQRRLLRDVSHELRTPLARLNLALELVRRKSPPEAETALARIELEAQRLDTMIGELLTLSRLEAGVGMETPNRIDLRAVVEALVADIGLEAEKNGSRVELQAGDASIDGNEELIRRAVENILRNAVRYTEPGTSVDVKLGPHGEHGAIAIVIRDHGPGVPEEALPKIFEPFYRVADDRARKSGGTGIGLAIAERAVKLHEGTVVAKNAAAGGLEVTILLPSSRDGATASE
ncbi:MAG: HAMP domain-containing protein [Polyangiaceae bacterium]|nr:HAMP domain-containing protein [Polyangiaceae bacterium]